MNRAEFYKLPIVCDGGHEHYETLARLISSDVVGCEICGQPVQVKEEDRSWAHRVVEDFKKITPGADALFPDELPVK